MKLMPFHREHLNLMDAREYERDHLIPNLSGAFFDLAESRPHCYTMIADGRIISCIGAFPLWDGVWECWQIPSIYVHKYTKDYARTLWGIFDKAAERDNFRRLQTSAPNDELHNRWMEFIGFECEGLMKGYSRTGVDYKMWARRYNYGR